MTNNTSRVNFKRWDDGETSVYDIKTGAHLGEFVKEGKMYTVFRKDANGEESGSVYTVEEAIDLLCN